MDSKNIYTFLRENIKYKRNQEISTLARYYLYSCIFELPQKDILFYYSTTNIFSIVGLLHFTQEEILTNELNLDLKIKQRNALNKIYKSFVTGSANVALLQLLTRIIDSDTKVLEIINNVSKEFDIDSMYLIKLLQIEVEQLLRIFVFTEDTEELYKEFINNIELINKSGISNNNVRFFLCNFTSNYLETFNPGEFYALNNSITIAGLYSGVDTKLLKAKLDYYKSVINSKDYLSKKVDYFIKINSINRIDFEYIFNTLSELNRKDLDFLINFSKILYSPTKDIKELGEYKFDLITDSEKAYSALDSIRAKLVLVSEISQFFNLTIKYKVNFLEYFSEFNINLLHFIFENAPVLSVLYSTFEGNMEHEVTEDSKKHIITRIENKARFIIDILNDFIGTPLNFEIYNLNRLNTILKKIIELRTIVDICSDSNGVIVNIINTSLRYDLIDQNTIDIPALINIEDIKAEDLEGIMINLNSKAVAAYKAILSGIFSVSNGYSLLKVAQKSLANDEDINTSIELKQLIENLRVVGFNNIFFEDNKNFFSFNKEVFFEYLNSSSI